MDNKDFVAERKLAYNIVFSIVLVAIGWAIINDELSRIIVMVLPFTILSLVGITLIWLPAKPEPKAGREEEEKP